MAEVCIHALTHAIPGIIDRLNAHIDERLEHLAARQRVNLNVRAPKRARCVRPTSSCRSVVFLLPLVVSYLRAGVLERTAVQGM